MNHIAPAPKVTYSTLETDFLIENGDTITVMGILIANGTASAITVEITEADTTTDILVFRVPADESVSLDTAFLADRGMYVYGSVVGDAAASITVFHSNAGA